MTVFSTCWSLSIMKWWALAKLPGPTGENLFELQVNHFEERAKKLCANYRPSDKVIGGDRWRAGPAAVIVPLG